MPKFVVWAELTFDVATVVDAENEAEAERIAADRAPPDLLPAAEGAGWRTLSDDEGELEITSIEEAKDLPRMLGTK